MGLRSEQKRRTNVTASRTTGRDRRGATRSAAWHAVERLERRTLLSSTLDAAVPAQIAPSAAAQQLFAPGTTTVGLSTPGGLQVVGGSLFRFTTAGTGPTTTVTFATTAVNPATDVALALFDADGNRLQLADADTPTAGTESLTATLSTRTAYVLGVYSDTTRYTSRLPGGQPVANALPFTLTATTAQPSNSAVTALGTGTATLTVGTGHPDVLAAPADANYFPLAFTNAGQSAQVVVSPAGGDAAQVYAQLFEQEAGGVYTSVASGSAATAGASVTLAVPPPAGGDVTDAAYLLAVSTVGFDTTPVAYQVGLSAASLVAPATVSFVPGSSQLAYGPLVPASPGTAAAGYPVTGFSNYVYNGGDVGSVVAVATGPLTFTAESTTSSESVAVYDSTGAHLLAVSGQTATFATATATISATAGTTYLYRVANDDNSTDATFGEVVNVAATQAVTPTPLSASTYTTGTVANLSPAATGGAFYRVTPPPGADYLVLQLTPSNAGSAGPAPALAYAAPGVTGHYSYSAAAGQPLVVPIDLTATPGPFDVDVQPVTGGTVTLSYRAISVPRTIGIGQLPTQQLDLKTGGASASFANVSAGQLVGLQFWEPAPSTDEGFVVTGTDSPLALRYVQQGGVLTLDAKSLPSAGTSGLDAVLSPAKLYAVAALPLALTGSSTVTVAVNGQAPAGVGVATVPSAAAATTAQLRIRNVVLTSPYERDVFSTLLPVNLTGAAPTVTYAPSSSRSTLAATVSVYNASGTVLATATSTPGGSLSFSLPAAAAAAAAGQQLRFTVQSANNGPVGDGTYTLTMTETTTDPTPYLVTEPAFYPYGVGPNQDPPYGPGAGVIPGDLPLATGPVNVPYGGSASGDFTNPIPYYYFPDGNPGSIALYSFTLPNLTTPFQVSTADVDPTVNTDLALYYLDTYGVYLPVPGTALSTDYNPGDRLPVDARVIVNNYHLFDTAFPYEAGGSANTTFYAVVKNEQATTGRFTISVGPTGDTNVTPDGSYGLTTLPYLPNPVGNAPRTLPATPPVTAPSVAGGAVAVSPDGHLATDLYYGQGVSSAAGGGTFAVNTAGTVSLSFTPSNFADVAYVALYQLENYGPIRVVPAADPATDGGPMAATPAFNFPPGGYYGNLITYATDGPVYANFKLSANVSPGVYYLVMFAPGTTSGAGTIRAVGTIPGFTATTVTLDPNTAENDTSALRQVAAPGQYGTAFFQVTVPADAQGPISVDLTPMYALDTQYTEAALWRVDAYGYYDLISTAYSTPVTYPTTPPSFVLSADGDTAPAGTHYYVGLYTANPNGIIGTVFVGASFPVPQSADPDLVVQPISLTSNDGKTRVTVTVTNPSFASAGASDAKLTLSNYPSPITLNLAAVGPEGSVQYTYDAWQPNAPSNTVTFADNYDRLTPETNFNNDSAAVALSSVDPNAPTVSIALADPTLSGESTYLTWGRYLAGVRGVATTVDVTGNDADHDLYSVTATGGVATGSVAGSYFPTLLALPVDFGNLSPTTAANPNLIQYEATDAYGLSTGLLTQHVDVVPKPSFYTSVTWDPANRVYDLGFVDNLLDYHKTVSNILGVSVPVVGDEDNEFSVGLAATGTATLNPATPVSLPLTGHVTIKALDDTLYDQTFNGSSQPTDHLSLHTTVTVNPRTLDASAAAVSLQLQNLTLLDVESPEIPLFELGVPGVADVEAGVKFGLSAGLSAGVKLGLNPAFLTSPATAPFTVGVLSPTFVQPTVTGTATIEGSVNVFSIPLASLEGTVGLTLAVTIGLDNNDPSKVFSLSDFANHLAVTVTATLGVEADASFLFWDATLLNYSHTFPIASTATQGILTTDPADGGGGGATGAATPLVTPANASEGTVAPTGTQTVGAYPVAPDPQIVIDPATGTALTVQDVNVSPTPATSTVSNLEFSRRVNGVWSAQQVLTGPDAEQPALALTHDGAAGTVPAVVVYTGLNAPGGAAGSSLTFSQRFAADDVRYRYFNGTAWSAEQSVTSDQLDDADPSVGFNAAGAGLTAWVHNTNPTPMDAAGNYSGATTDIEAAVWNPATHTFGSPVAISVPNDGVADAQPAAFVDAAGHQYVVWVQTTAAGASQLMYSLNAGHGWSNPAPLSGYGSLPTGGTVGSVAVGSDKTGGVDVLFAYQVQNADGSIDSRLYNLPLSTGAVEQIAGGQNYTALRTTNAPDGSLVAYWQQEDGITNGVYESTLARTTANPSAPWSTPIRLTSTTNLTLDPSVAVDTTGQFQTLYNTGVPTGGTASTAPTDPAVGVTLAPGAGGSSIASTLPELTFTTGLTFPSQSLAVVGNTVTGTATILNRGAGPATATVTWYAGTPTTGTLLGTRTITLAAGDSYAFSAPFTVAAGTQAYSVKVAATTAEAVTTADDVSTATLTGLPDLSIPSLTATDANPTPGETVLLTADVHDAGGQAVGPFAVTLYAGDPRFPQTAPVALATQAVPTIAANGDVTLTFNLTLPTAAGTYVYTLKADSGGAVAEAVENNNEAQYGVTFAADPTVRTDIGVTATQLSDAPSNNVQVLAYVDDLGTVPAANVPVDLLVSRNGGPFVQVATQTFGTLSPSSPQYVLFTVTSLAGDNVYRVQIDPSVAADSDPTNDVGQADLVVNGLADLTVGSVALSTATPTSGGPLTLTATVADGGIADAAGVLVEVFAVPTNNPAATPVLVGSTTLAAVPALGSTPVSLSLATGGLLGPYTLTVQVNRLNAVPESNALNDTATTTVTFGTTTAVTLPAGQSNAVILSVDAGSSAYGDVWVNDPTESGSPTAVYSLAGSLTITGGGQTDTVTIDNANSATGDPAAALPVRLVLTGSTFSFPQLPVEGGKTVALTGPAHATLLVVGTLRYPGGTTGGYGTLDLGADDLVVNSVYDPRPTLGVTTTFAGLGYAAGTWSGPGITSSAAAADPTRTTALGVIANDDGTGHPLYGSGAPLGLFDGYSPADGAILVRYTLYGDATLDGAVNGADYARIDAGRQPRRPDRLVQRRLQLRRQGRRQRLHAGRQRLQPPAAGRRDGDAGRRRRHDVHDPRRPGRRRRQPRDLRRRHRRRRREGGRRRLGRRRRPDRARHHRPVAGRVARRVAVAAGPDRRRRGRPRRLGRITRGDPVAGQQPSRRRLRRRGVDGPGDRPAARPPPTPAGCTPSASSPTTTGPATASTAAAPPSACSTPSTPPRRRPGPLHVLRRRQPRRRSTAATTPGSTPASSASRRPPR